jgi:hypothetical protein
MGALTNLVHKFISLNINLSAVLLICLYICTQLRGFHFNLIASVNRLKRRNRNQFEIVRTVIARFWHVLVRLEPA